MPRYADQAMGLVLFVAVTSLLLAGLNYYLYSKARRLVLRWRSGEAARRWIQGGCGPASC